MLVAGKDCGEAAKSAAAHRRASTKVLQAEDAAYANWLAEDIAPLVVKLAPNYSHIVMAADSVGKNVAPRVAALLDVGQVSEAIQVVSPDTFVRPIYAGNAMATVQTGRQDQGRHHPPDQLQGGGRRRLGARSSRSAARAPRACRPMSAPSSPRASGPSSPRPRSSSRAAAAWRSGENFKILEALADKLGAGLGASRAAVDAGYVPNDYQVGQTGKVVAPDLYIAVGISGAIQHLAGMKDSKTIVAINKDEEAPIFQVADYGIVGDLFQIVPELTAAVDKK